MRSLRYHRYGDPADVLQLEEIEPPEPGPGQIRIEVEACGLTPADWALCQGLFAGDLPRGIGLEAAGTVQARGREASGVAVGDRVFGPVPYAAVSAGAAGFAVLDEWFPAPDGLDPVDAAALPMAVETASRGLRELGVESGATVLVNGAGSTIGFAAVQIALRRGARVLGTAGVTFADRLTGLGAEVTGYGDGLADRVLGLAGGPVDLVFDTSPVPGAMPELLRTVTAPDRILTVGDPDGPSVYGVRTSITAAAVDSAVLGEYGELAAAGEFSIPVAGTFALEDWRAAMDLSRSGHAHGKLVVVPGDRDR